jgi:hypothetical protein
MYLRPVSGREARVSLVSISVRSVRPFECAPGARTSRRTIRAAARAAGMIVGRASGPGHVQASDPGLAPKELAPVVAGFTVSAVRAVPGRRDGTGATAALRGV